MLRLWRSKGCGARWVERSDAVRIMAGWGGGGEERADRGWAGDSIGDWMLLGEDID
jgi:hypothetical protein